MTSEIYIAVVTAIIVFTVLIAVKLYLAQRRSRFARIFLDGAGILVLLPTIVILFAIFDMDPAGRAMTGFGAFLIYSVVSLGVVPILTLCMIILTIRLALRTYRRNIFA